MARACKDCGEEKALEEFAKNRNRPGGRASRCKACIRERVRKGREEGRYKQKAPGGFKVPRRTEKTRAREAAARALKRGQLRKPMTCEDCKKPKHPDELQMHHDDHRRARNVRFLCVTCHRKRDQ